MKKLFDDTGDIWFSCGCREWRICLKDEKGIHKQPEDTVLDHDCKNITVYRQGLKRFFMNKLSTPISLK